MNSQLMHILHVAYYSGHNHTEHKDVGMQECDDFARFSTNEHVCTSTGTPHRQTWRAAAWSTIAAAVAIMQSDAIIRKGLGATVAEKNDARGKNATSADKSLFSPRVSQITRPSSEASVASSVTCECRGCECAAGDRGRGNVSFFLCDNARNGWKMNRFGLLDLLVSEQHVSCRDHGYDLHVDLAWL